jgi:hypothetical protein
MSEPAATPQAAGMVQQTLQAGRVCVHTRQQSNQQQGKHGTLL